MLHNFLISLQILLVIIKVLIKKAKETLLSKCCYLSNCQILSLVILGKTIWHSESVIESFGRSKNRISKPFWYSVSTTTYVLRHRKKAVLASQLPKNSHTHQGQPCRTFVQLLLCIYSFCSIVRICILHILRMCINLTK